MPPILAFDDASSKAKTIRSVLTEILMSGNVPIDEDTSCQIWRVKCKQCKWKQELGEGVHREIGTARARVHRRETGHTDIRFRFDMLDVGAGPVDVRGREEFGR